MTSTILVLNAGSSSLKFALFAIDAAEPQCELRGHVDLHTDPAQLAVTTADGQVLPLRSCARGQAGALQAVLDLLHERGVTAHIVAAGHRVVHGAEQFTAPVRVNATVLAALHALCPLAPLHQPSNLAAIEALARLWPDLPQIACFDTAFHASMPWEETAFALPGAISARGVRRYGFHGLSYQSIMHQLESAPDFERSTRIVILHLGSGASLCAVHAGRSVATTMGFSTLDGLPMATRCGALDPGVILHLMNEMKLDSPSIEHMLYQESGLLGVSGISADMRVLEQSKDAAAARAIELFTYHAARELGAMAAALGGIDQIVFTAGIGEHSALVREKIANRCQWLGVQLDPAANQQHAAQISNDGSAVLLRMMRTDEEAQIARAAALLLHPLR